ncbi:hypothetical protein PP654_gp047 [Bacillus phage v_B-Bak10]|uniref:Uncharacterized protein n=2 Tax=Basiliskvirus TaxID=3044670 RepID=A0A385IK31_9CAUD|nr:hypothetical protein PP653_gp057 [Bacillus phage Basilisk]YP_010657002.1 hypothetical protein PP654_gp047 [Bacillus phage v_B-Bak10]AGR46702.1 hypothetical protein BASILISK_110 [Bacillus phage Basilisk]AXY83255.1 hypothetical protein vBBBak10_095 [Bacillus phage v_B-Bak10]
MVVTMTNKKTKRPKPEVGQTVYVTISGWLNNSDKIYKYIVTKVNTVSFYAREISSDREYRFDLKTFTHKGTFDYYYAYHTKEEILKMQAVSKEKKVLKAEIESELKYPLPLTVLRAIKEMIDNHKVKR